MERALRERRERADLLDLVAPELDAQRLASGRREDVDEPAAHGELPALVGPLDALVARERERLGQLLETQLLARRDPDRLRARARGRHRLRERGCRRDRRGRRPRGRRAHARARRRGAAPGRGRSPSGRRGSAAARRAPRRRTTRRPPRRRARPRPPAPAARAAGRAPRATPRAAAAAQARTRVQRPGRPRRSRAAGRVSRSSSNERMKDRTVHDERPNPAGSAAAMVTRMTVHPSRSCGDGSGR